MNRTYTSQTEHRAMQAQAQEPNPDDVQAEYAAAFAQDDFAADEFLREMDCE